MATLRELKKVIKEKSDLNFKLRSAYYKLSKVSEDLTFEQRQDIKEQERNIDNYKKPRFTFLKKNEIYEDLLMEIWRLKLELDAKDEDLRKYAEKKFEKRFKCETRLKLTSFCYYDSIASRTRYRYKTDRNYGARECIRIPGMIDPEADRNYYARRGIKIPVLINVRIYYPMCVCPNHLRSPRWQPNIYVM
jgi:hypothetical protein